MVNLRGIFVLGLFVFMPGTNGIYRGTLATLAAYKHLVSIWLEGNYKCGGSIISDRHILTAAQCIYQEPLHIIAVKGKSVSLAETELLPSVERVIVSDDYALMLFANDLDVYRQHNIAVLKLVAPITFSARLQPIKLDQSPALPASCNPCFVAGWGQESLGAQHHSQKLRHTPVLQVQVDPYAPVDPRIMPNEFRVKSTRQFSAVGKGDTGGSLLCDDKASGILIRTGDFHESIILHIYPYLSWINMAMIDNPLEIIFSDDEESTHAQNQWAYQVSDSG